MNDENFNLDERVLCSDGACIGLVGSDGRCKVCGAAYRGDDPLPTTEAEGGAGGGEEMSPFDLPAGEAPDDDAENSAPDGETTEPSTASEPDRICCTDETCIGIIGKDGKCGTCGKPV